MIVHNHAPLRMSQKHARMLSSVQRSLAGTSLYVYLMAQSTCKVQVAFTHEHQGCFDQLRMAIVQDSS